MLKYELSPSILAADFCRLGEQVAEAERAGAGYIHLDVMDGAFVPSISFGMPVIQSLRKNSKMIFDVHLMIEDPDRYLEDFAKAGADILTVHAEACTHLDRTIQKIHSLGCRAGVALNPATSLDCLEWIAPQTDMILLMSVNPGFGGQSYIPYVTEKIQKLRRYLNEKGINTDIEVDGGVTVKNVDEIMEAGANILVAGSAVFRGDITENVKNFLNHFEQMQAGERK